MENTTGLDDELHWYKDAIIYELHIKAFCDGDGDGVGDFQGLMQKLDYLQELGVTAIWLLPFYPSPLKDDGYDISDYYNINPVYGDITRFRHFLKEAHKRNLKVITELVINHTSDQHSWFQRARTAPKGSRERDYYVWTDDPDQYKEVRIIFQDFEASNWTWDPVAGQYYWHRFFHHQPDLNYDNPLVQEEVFSIISYWCKMGVDGFRLDAVPYLYEREGTNGENLPETHAFLKKLRKHVDEHFPGTVLLAEANMWPEDAASYFGEGDECHMNYHFPVMPRIFMALQMEDRYPITDIFDQTPDIPAICQWAIFLRNHDELTLEMVTDEERDYMYRVYARDPKAKINLGIRHRLAPLLNNSRRRIELLNALLFSLPGTPVIYYGDEIGMGDNVYLGDRDGVRTPMQWSPDRNAGFSAANPQKLYLPLILDPEYHYESVNVETQRGNTSSLLWYMKRLINVRNKFKTFGRGSMKFVNVENPKVLVFTRSYEDETLLIVVNLSKFSQAAEVDLQGYKGYVPVDLFSKNRFPVIKEDGQYFFTLAPYTFQWFALEKAHPEMDEEKPLPLLLIRDWEAMMEGPGRRQLENNILPRYLQKAKWFMGKERVMYNVNIVHFIKAPGNGHSVFWLLLEIAERNGTSGLYQLPVYFVKEESAKGKDPVGPVDPVKEGEGAGAVKKREVSSNEREGSAKELEDSAKGMKGSAKEHDDSAKGMEDLVKEKQGSVKVMEGPVKKLAASFPEAVIAQVRCQEGDGVLVDAFFVPEFQMDILSRVMGNKAIPVPGQRIEFSGSQSMKKLFSAQIAEQKEMSSRIHVSDLYNTSIAYDGLFFLKMYRKVDITTNPDLEVTSYLSREEKFKYIPAFTGEIEWKSKDSCIVLGMMQEMVENHGDGHSFFMERVENYIERIQAANKPVQLWQQRQGTLMDPKTFDELTEELQTLLGAPAAEQARQLGVRTAQMHLALSSGTEKEFKPEPFSIYYQRSLFSSLQSLVRETYQLLSRNMKKLPADLQANAERIMAYRPQLVNIFRRINGGKLDALKIRVHGNYHLGQVLLTGKDIAINDFSGNPSLTYSERRLKRSPFVDLSSMTLSLYRVAFEGVLDNHQLQETQIDELLPFAGLWAHYMTGFFIRAYRETIGKVALVPLRSPDFEAMWRTFLLQQALMAFNEALLENSTRLIIPLTLIRAALADTASSEPAAAVAAPVAVAPVVAAVVPAPAVVPAASSTISSGTSVAAAMDGAPAMSAAAGVPAASAAVRSGSTEGPARSGATEGPARSGATEGPARSTGIPSGPAGPSSGTAGSPVSGSKL